MIQFYFTNGGKNLIAKIILFADIHKLKYTNVNKILTKVYNFTTKLAIIRFCIARKRYA